MKVLAIGSVIALTITAFSSAAYANHQPWRPVTTGGAASQQLMRNMQEHRGANQQTSTAPSNIEVQQPKVKSNAEVQPAAERVNVGSQAPLQPVTTGGAAAQQLRERSRGR